MIGKTLPDTPARNWRRSLTTVAASLAVGAAALAAAAPADAATAQPNVTVTCGAWYKVGNHAEDDCTATGGTVRLVAECTFPFPWVGSAWRSGRVHLVTPDCGFTGFVNAHYEVQ